MAYLLKGEWESISVIAGYPVGASVYIQNSGRAGDIVEIIISSGKPDDTARGWAIRSLDPSFRVSGQDFDVWVRYIRYDIAGTIIPEPARRCLTNISDNEQITQASTFPVDSNSAIMQTIINDLISDLTEASKETAYQLTLLNRRFEEAFETGIFEDDIE